MIRLILSFVILFITVNVMAQELSEDLNEAKSVFTTGNYEKALEKCSQIINASEGRDSIDIATAYSYAGLSCENLNKSTEAIEYYKLAINYDVPQLDIYELLLNSAKNTGDEESYEWALKAKKKKFPEFKIEVSQSLTQHYLKTKNYEGVLTESDELLAMYPENTKFLYYKGLAYQNLDKEEEAYSIYEKIIELESGHIGANMGAGVYLYKKGSVMFKKEKAQYEAKKSPTRVDYTNYQKSIEDAKEVYSQALKYLLVAYEDGGKTNLKGAIANIYTRLGETDKAAQYK